MRSDGNEENRRNDGPATHAGRRRDRSMQASYSSRWIMSRRAILVLVLLSLACGDEVTEPKPEATKVEPVGSNKLTGTVGSALEVMPTVRVLVAPPVHWTSPWLNQAARRVSSRRTSAGVR